MPRVNDAGFRLLALTVLLTSWSFAAGDEEPVPAWPEAVRRRNAEMKRRVDAWLAKGRAARMPVHVVYLSCSDQDPFPGHRDRLNRVLTEVQEWMAAQHRALGFGRTTMALERDDTGLVKLHEGKLPFTVAGRTAKNRGETHKACVAAAKRLLTGTGVDYGKSFVLVLTTIPDDHGAAPFFGNIIQDRGYCFAVDTPWLDSEYTRVDGPKVWKGKPVGPANSALVGGITHELGHGLGLPHSDELKHQKKFGESLMASGNYTWRSEKRGKGKGSFLLDTDAMLLIARPPFTGRVRDFDRQPDARVEGLRFEEHDDGRVTVTGTVRSDIPAHAVKLVDDPPNGNDYNSVAHAALPDEKTGAFTLTFRPHPAAGEHGLRLFLYHVNGRWTRVVSTMQVDGQGKADLSKARLEMLRLPEPSAVEGTTCPLARAKPASAKVGWGRLLAGRTPSGPIRIAGKPRPDGLFVHAPSRVVYDLGGKWTTLTVTAGLQDGSGRKATFRVVGDGRTLSEVSDLPGGKARDLELDVTGVRRLELITEPPRAGNRSCWTTWADPTLRR